MFNKEESINNTNCKIIDKINMKKVGAALLTVTLLGSMNNVKAEDNPYHYKVNEYYQRVEDYMDEKEYDLEFFKLYHVGRFIIDGKEIDIDRVFIVAGYVNNELNMSLYTAKIGKKNFITGEDINYEKPVLIPLIQTTLFKTMLDENLLIVNDRYISFDMTKIEEIKDAIDKWDGMAHSLVPETDALDNKVFIEKDEAKKYEK